VKVVPDTNVFVSGGFFAGPPHKIFEAWGDSKGQERFGVEETVGVGSSLSQMTCEDVTLPFPLVWRMREVLKEFEKRNISSFAGPYKLSSFFFVNNPVRLFINPLPGTNRNKFDLGRVFDPVYDSERAYPETS
jgi:hypothetical protein